MSKTIIEQLKQAGQEKEWYPTTDEIIKVVKADLEYSNTPGVSYYDFSMLDIGAGNGKVLNALGAKKKYAIEQSEILINNMPKNIYTIGRDFHQNDLTDKEVDVIFCNPPYSEYAQWTARIILEGRTKYIYLVIPERWKENKTILEAIETRDVRIQNLGKYSFENSEDRKARAVVNLVRVDLIRSRVNPFTIAFKTMFADQIKEEVEEEQIEPDDKFEVAAGENLIDTLLSIYLDEMLKIQASYAAVMSLDNAILREIGFDVDKASISLQEKLKGLKTLYWDRLFRNFDKITERLTSTSRRDMLGTINAGKMIDFNRENVYMVVMWAIRNANTYYDDQLITLYKQFSNSENVTNFKSNKKWYNDRWRFNKEASHYKLDTRIIVQSYQALGDYKWMDARLSGNAAVMLQDIITIANNLGFISRSTVEEFDWEYGEKYNFMTGDDILFEVKFFKKGTIHIKFNMKFLAAFNLEASRLLGWIKSPQEAADEMDIDITEAQHYFKSNIQLGSGDVKLLGNMV